MTGRWAIALCIGALAALLGGCAQFPATPLRPVSRALPPAPGSVLAELASQPEALAGQTGARLVPDSRQALDARRQLAASALRSLDVQYFLWRDDSTGRQLLRDLRDAAERGVRVRLLLDDLYAVGLDDLLRGLAAHANVEVLLFNPLPARLPNPYLRFLASPQLLERLNHRMHNKLFLADGAVAITGGRNIGDEYFSQHASFNFIDLDVLVVGAAVEELATTFDRFWNSTVAYPLAAISGAPGTAEERRRRFEAVTAPGEPLQSPGQEAQDALGQGPVAREIADGRIELAWGFVETFADPPEKVLFSAHAGGSGDAYGKSRVKESVTDHLAHAKEEVLFVSPYFVPGRSGLDLLRQVLARGSRLIVLTNSLASTDQPLVHSGYRRYRRPLLEAGAELYELSAVKANRKGRRVLFGVSVGGLHAKAVLIDRKDAFIGSMNFDPRSDHFNTESGLFIHSAKIAKQISQLAEIGMREASHRVLLTPHGLEWVALAVAEDAHRSEPEVSLWQEIWLNLVAPLAPESML